MMCIHRFNPLDNPGMKPSGSKRSRRSRWSPIPTNTLNHQRSVLLLMRSDTLLQVIYFRPPPSDNSTSPDPTGHLSPPLNDCQAPPEGTVDHLQLARHTIWQRTGFRLNSLKSTKLHLDTSFSSQLEAWRAERHNPTTPPPSHYTHKMKFLHTAPELGDLWSPQQFLR